MARIGWCLMISWAVLLLIMAALTDTLAFLCLSFELGTAAVMAWKIRAAYKRAE
jgi:hypothetical protein